MKPTLDYSTPEPQENDHDVIDNHDSELATTSLPPTAAASAQDNASDKVTETHDDESTQVNSATRYIAATDHTTEDAHSEHGQLTPNDDCAFQGGEYQP